MRWHQRGIYINDPGETYSRMSSSGGELFGRLMTRKSHETLFIFGGLPCHSRTYDIALPPMWCIQFAIAVFAS